MGTLSKTADQLAYEAVAAIISDLNDRSGLGIEICDDDIQREIREAWEEIVASVIQAAEHDSW